MIQHNIKEDGLFTSVGKKMDGLDFRKGELRMGAFLSLFKGFKYHTNRVLMMLVLVPLFMRTFDFARNFNKPIENGQVVEAEGFQKSFQNLLIRLHLKNTGDYKDIWSDNYLGYLKGRPDLVLLVILYSIGACVRINQMRSRTKSERKTNDDHLQNLKNNINEAFKNFGLTEENINNLEQEIKSNHPKDQSKITSHFIDKLIQVTLLKKINEIGTYDTNNRFNRSLFAAINCDIDDSIIAVNNRIDEVQKNDFLLKLEIDQEEHEHDLEDVTTLGIIGTGGGIADAIDGFLTTKKLEAFLGAFGSGISFILMAYLATIVLRRIHRGAVDLPHKQVEAALEESKQYAFEIFERRNQLAKKLYYEAQEKLAQKSASTYKKKP